MPNRFVLLFSLAILTGMSGCACAPCGKGGLGASMGAAKCRACSWFHPTNHCGLNCYNPCMDAAKVKRRARCLARQSLRNCAGHGSSCHFEQGFEQAFVDMAEGGNGTVPAMPPPRYWGTDYRTAQGYTRAAEWFDGYRAGTTLAEAQGLREFNRVPLSTGMLASSFGTGEPVAPVEVIQAKAGGETTRQ